MGDAGNQTSQCCEFFRLDQRMLGLAQMLQCRLGGGLSSADLLLIALALTDINVGADPAINRTVCVMQRDRPRQERAVLAVAAAQRQLEFERYAGLKCTRPLRTDVRLRCG